MAHHDTTHALPPTGSVWAISDTASKTVTFATGMLEAATSDNINPVALRCCESFGSLLPLSIETRLKVEQLARRNHTSHVLNFIKGQIGYKKGDSVELLSRSDAGVRFLCLAATLCTLDHYDAANRLDALLSATQKEDQLRPTIKQLQVMMNTLKTKMMLSDYANLVAGWEIFARYELANCGPDYNFDIAQIPSKTSLQDLVLTMNELGRVGELNVIDIKLRPEQVAWTWAFIQWCLGSLPSVRTSSGHSVIHEKTSPITLTIMPQTWDPKSRKRRYDTIDRNMEVSLQKTVHGLKEIVFFEEGDSKKWAWQGLVPVNTWIRYHFAILHDRFPQIREDARLRSAVGQAFFFIVGVLPERLLLSEDYKALRRGLELQDGQLEDLFHATAPTPFLNATSRLRIAQELLNDHIQLVKEDQDPDMTLAPANLAKAFGGACRQCSSPVQNSILGGTLPCKVNSFLEAIGSMGAALLTFTLFGPLPEHYPLILAGLRFDTAPFHHRLTPLKSSTAIASYNWPRLITTAWQALMHGQCKSLSCSPISIFKHAAALMGQEKIWESTIISSKSGQVLLPAFFEAREFMREGYMQLCAFPGKLMKDGMQFDFLLDAFSDRIHTEGLSDLGSEEEIPSDDDDDDDEGDGHDQPKPLAWNSGERAAASEAEPADSTTGLRPAASRGASNGSSRSFSDGDENPPDREVPENRGKQIPGSGEGVDEPNDEHVAQAALEPNPEMNLSIISQDKVPRTFTASKNRTTSSKEGMEWKISIQDELLRGELFMKDTNNPVIAWSLIDSLARSRLTVPCSHKSNEPAGDVADTFTLAKPPITTQRSEGSKKLFHVGREYAEQLAGLEQQDYFPPTVVHVDGCVGCALRLCNEVGSALVIS